MGPIERVQSVLEGRRPDCAPVSFWFHFPPEQVSGPGAVAAHLTHLAEYELDFLKVMNDNAYPQSLCAERVEDLGALTVLKGDEGEFARQLDLLADLKRALGGRVMMTSTLFNAWTTLRHLIRPPGDKHDPPDMDAADEPTRKIHAFYTQAPDAVRTALGTIAASLGNFARRCIEAGSDGVFLSVRDDWLARASGDTRLYEELVRSTDLEILAGAAAGRLNVLHVCGLPFDLRAFGEYPVHVINWADRAAGPSIAEVCGWSKPAICAGVDNLATLPHGTPTDCEREVIDALAQAGERPIMIAPGCTFDPEQVPRENLEAVCAAAHRVWR